jgi:hypothetical protein
VLVYAHGSDSQARIFFIARGKVEKPSNNILDFSPYLKENTTCLYYNDQLVNLFKEVIAVYYETHTLCGQNAVIER